MRLVLTAAAFLILATPANAGFQVGVVNPTPVPAADSAALGITVQRYDITWHDAQSLTRSLDLAPDTRPVIAVYPITGDWLEQPGFCDWVNSILDRYPMVKDVIVGNEVKLSEAQDYAEVLKVCSPMIRAHGANVIGPGTHPAVPVSYLTPLVQTIADAGSHLLDAWDVHIYWMNLDDVISLVRYTLGWQIPIWVTEDGAQSKPGAGFENLYSGMPDSLWDGGVSEDVQAEIMAQQMLHAYCSGVAVWLNFLLVDEANLGRWQSGLERPDRSHKLAYAAFAEMAHRIATGSAQCYSNPRTGPSSHTNKEAPERISNTRVSNGSNGWIKYTP